MDRDVVDQIPGGEVDVFFGYNSREWTSNIVASLFNKVIVILEDLVSDVDWNVGVRRYSKQKGLLTSKEKISGLPDTDDNSDDAKEHRRRIVEFAERNRPAVVELVLAKVVSAEQVSSPSGSSQWRRRTKTMAPKRKKSKTSGSFDDGSSQAKESEPASTVPASVEAPSLLPEEVIFLEISIEVAKEAEKEEVADVEATPTGVSGS